MNIYLFKNEGLYTLSLPLKIKGQYWITDYDINGKERKIVNIEERDGKWVLKSNRKVSFLDESGEAVKGITVENQEFYRAFIKTDEQTVLLYAEETEEGRNLYQKYRVQEGAGITIGRSESCDICFKNILTSSGHAQITYQNEEWTVKDLQSSNGTYLNEKRVFEEKADFGDVLFVMGMKIILGRGFIAVNNPDKCVFCSSRFLKEFPALEFYSEKSGIEEDEDAFEEKFFYRTPRFRRDVETARIKIDPPPNDQIGEELPLALVIGPSLTMGLASMTTGIFAINNAMQTGNIASAIPSVAMSFSMLLGTVMWPILSKRFEKKRKRAKEAKRQEKYSRYLETIEEEIETEVQKQAEVLNENHISVGKCVEKIETKAISLWERGFGQKDFLEFRIGTGELPLDAEIVYPERRFTLDDDNLQEEMLALGEKEKLIRDVPISISLFEDFVAGVVGSRRELRDFGKGLIMQIAALYGYDEVKMCFLLGSDAQEMSFVKWLPHVWDDEKNNRFVAANTSEAKELSAFLSKVAEAREELSDNEIGEAQPYYIIFCFDKELADRTEVIRKIYSLKKNINISVVSLFDEFKDLPKECSAVIELQEETGLIYNKKDISGKKLLFKPDIYIRENADKYSTQLANIYLDVQGAGFNLPNLIPFLQLFGVGRIEHLNALQRWKENNPTKSLQTEVGVNTLGDKFMLDLHEKYHGPHGLVAGMTGSGKSEFIMTYILSLAVNYHPYEVAFILIDYKGGGMAKTFEKLPHTAGIITNLDGAAIKRSLISIESELKRRQKIFSDISKEIGTSNIDIYEYQKLYREGIANEPLQHLFIISDEFAELKAQQPEFMAQLISTARIGRSLGVHLILATQKPAGVVDDQIWSNSKFKVCLKVQDRADSMDMLKRPDAAELTRTGRFYLQVGYNELFELGQSAWSGAEYQPSDRLTKQLDDSVSIINNNGLVIKSYRPYRDVRIGKKSKQVDAVTRYLSEIADEENIKVRPLWLEPIPQMILLDEVDAKYHKSKGRGLNPTIGEYDNPYNQKQDIFCLPISDTGNAAIFGAAGSGKTDFLNAMIYSLLKENTPDEVNLYILDFAAETMWMFAKAPQVGEVMFSHDSEKISNLFKVLYKEIAGRKKKFAAYGGNIDEYVKDSGEKVPRIVIAVNNYAAFIELYGEREDDIIFLSREGTKYGIYFVITAVLPNNVRFRVLQNFAQQITLQMSDESEYSSIVGKTDGVLPSNFEGRGLVRMERVYEFQTAKLVKQGNPKQYVSNYCMNLSANWTGRKAAKIATMPENVTAEFFKETEAAGGQDLNLPVGIDTNSLAVVKYDFEKHYINCVLSQGDGYTTFLKELQKELREIENTQVRVLKESDIAQVFDEVLYRNNTYKDAVSLGEEHPSFARKVFLIEGLSERKQNLTEEENEKLQLILEKGRREYNLFFIIGETGKKMGSFTYEKWYKAHVRENCGIWIGNGFADQYCLKGSSGSRYFEELKDGYGYVLKEGKLTKAKLLWQTEENDE